jgi:hypothetical protein
MNRQVEHNSKAKSSVLMLHVGRERERIYARFITVNFLDFIEIFRLYQRPQLLLFFGPLCTSLTIQKGEEEEKKKKKE